MAYIPTYHTVSPYPINTNSHRIFVSDHGGNRTSEAKKRQWTAPASLRRKGRGWRKGCNLWAVFEGRSYGSHWYSRDIPSGKRLHNYGKSLFSMGKSGKSTISISMAIFNSKLLVITRGYIDIPSWTSIFLTVRSSHPHVKHVKHVKHPSKTLAFWGYTKCFASGSPDSWESHGKSLGFRTSIRCFRRVPGFPNFCACLLILYCTILF